MAAGDVTFFNQARVDIGKKVWDLNGDTIKLGLVTSAVTPAAADAAPHFGGTGTTNYATNQVTAGGNYASGGPSLTTVSWTPSGATAIWKADKVAIAQHASNPTNARWGILYNATDTNKRAIAFVDLGTTKDLSAASQEIRWNSVDGNGLIATLS